MPNKKLQELYIKSLQNRIRMMDELNTQVRKGDKTAFESMIRTVHTLTSSGATYGFPEISEISARMEEADPGDLSAYLQELKQAVEKYATDTMGSRSTLLVITADLQLLEEVRSALSEHFSEFSHSPTGQDAAERILGEKFSAIVLDMGIEDRDARSLILTIRESTGSLETPVIMISGIHSEDYRRECLSSGGNIYLLKPMQPAELREAVEAVVKKRLPDNQKDEDEKAGILQDRHEFRRKIAEYFELNPGKKPWVMLINAYDQDSRINDRRLDELGRHILRQVPQVINIYHCTTDDLILILPSMDTGSLESVLQRFERSITQESLLSAGIAAISSIRSALRMPRDENDVQNCILMMGKFIIYDEDPDFYKYIILHGQNREQIRILLIEDDNLISNLLTYRLQSDKVIFIRARDGEEGLEKAFSETFDAVLLDVKMPGMDGFHVLQNLRQRFDKETLPILMFTSMGREKDIVRGFKLGADDYILKPFSPQEVMLRIRRLLKSDI